MGTLKGDGIKFCSKFQSETVRIRKWWGIWILVCSGSGIANELVAAVLTGVGGRARQGDLGEAGGPTDAEGR